MAPSPKSKTPSLKRAAPTMLKSEEKKVCLPAVEPSCRGSARFSFQSCSDRRASDRLTCKKEAFHVGLRYAEKIIETLRSVDVNELPEDLKPILRDLVDIIDRHASHKILVGVCGATGAGKTCTINSLLEMPNLLTEGHFAAATAVATKVSFNPDKTTTKPFKAVVTFQTRESVLDELERMLEDAHTLQSLNHTGQQAGTTHAEETFDRAELEAQIEGTKQKYQGIFKHCDAPLWPIIRGKDLDQLREVAESVLESNLDAVALLDQAALEITAPSCDQLSEEIKPYTQAEQMQDGAPGSPRFPVWPLIIEVQLFIPVPALRDGLTLVDLPGRGEVNAARMAVTDSYESNLDIILAVAQTTRAASESIMASILSSHRQSQIHSEGIVERQRLAIVATKSDQISAAANICGRSSDVAITRQAITEYHAEGVRWKERIRALKRVTEAGGDAVQILKNDKEARITRITERLEELPTKGPNSLRAIRGRLTREINNLDNTVKDGLQLMATAVHRRDKADVARKIEDQKLAYKLVTARNAIVHGRLAASSRPQAEQPEDLDEQGEDVIPIFHTSSEAFWPTVLESTQYPLKPGYPQSSFSGIPSLRQWVQLTSAKCSEEHFDSLLADLGVNLALLESWASKGLRSYALQSGHSVQDKLESLNDSLDKAVRNEITEAFRVVESIRPFKSRPASRTEFKKKAILAVKNWIQKFPDDPTSTERLSYGTHAAILKRQGGVYYAKSWNVTYDWIGSLMATMFQQLQKRWTRSIDKAIAQAMNVAAEPIEAHWNTYAKAVAAVLNEADPDRDHEETVRRILLDIGISLVLALKSSLADLGRQLPRAPHQNTSDKAREFLRESCTHGLTLKAPKALDKRCMWLEDVVTTKSGQIFDDTAKAIDAALDKHRGNTRNESNKLLKQAIGRAQTAIAGDMGGGDAQTEAAIRRETQKITAGWAHEWRYPDTDADHGLLPVEDLPLELTVEHLGKDHPAVFCNNTSFYPLFAKGCEMDANACVDSDQTENSLALRIDRVIETIETRLANPRKD